MFLNKYYLDKLSPQTLRRFYYNPRYFTPLKPDWSNDGGDSPDWNRSHVRRYCALTLLHALKWKRSNTDGGVANDKRLVALTHWGTEWHVERASLRVYHIRMKRSPGQGCPRLFITTITFVTSKLRTCTIYQWFETAVCCNHERITPSK